MEWCNANVVSATHASKLFHDCIVCESMQEYVMQSMPAVCLIMSECCEGISVKSAIVEDVSEAMCI